MTLGSTDSLKISLTATNGKKPRKPHQCFLTLTDETTGLEESYPLSVKENGKAKLDLVIPSSRTLRAAYILLTKTDHQQHSNPTPRFFLAAQGIPSHRVLRYFDTLQKPRVRPHHRPRSDRSPTVSRETASIRRPPGDPSYFPRRSAFAAKDYHAPLPWCCPCVRARDIHFLGYAGRELGPSGQRDAGSPN